MQVFHLSAELYPLAKVGGLADVVGALPKYQNRLGLKSSVVIPKHKTKLINALKTKNIYKGTTQLGNQIYPFSIELDDKQTLGFPLYLIDIPELFTDEHIYSFNDVERYIAFQLAFLNWMLVSEQKPDLIHIHDHHVGFIPFLIKYAYAYRKFENVPTVLTIHNGQYHGNFGFDKLHYFPDFEHGRIGFLEWNGQIDPLAAAIKCAWKVTTVSSGYLEELTYQSGGLEDLIRSEINKSSGILNGIDIDVWNPQTDPFIENYSPRNFRKGKEANKKAICKTYNLDPEKPLFIFIGRLVYDKGADLIPNFISIALTQFYGQVNIMVLGSGDPEIENRLTNLVPVFKGNYNAFIGYNEQLSHQLYAAADFLFMPSRVEPCGLNQLYALRYGTIPIVRRTGGLKDTIIDIGDRGFGLCHVQANVDDLMHSLGRAIHLYKNEELMEKTIKTAMKINHSWENATQKYSNLYKEIVQNLPKTKK